MPSIAENVAKWSDHKWDREGHEWSPGGTATGTEMLWSRSILPRIQAFLPASTILEIAPGYGRWTQYLLPLATMLVGVDLSDKCVDACAHRFAGSHGVFLLNDGRSLPIEERSIDFAFSFDSLVHVEAPEVDSYLHELARVLKPGAAAWLHHSNLAAYASRGVVPAAFLNRLWRATSMSAQAFRNAARRAGLTCVSQELVNFVARGARSDRHRIPGSGIPLTDCFSLVVKPIHDAEVAWTNVYLNRRFVEEWRQLMVLAWLYRGAALPSSAGRGVAPRQPNVTRTLRSLEGRSFAAVRAAVQHRIEEWRDRTRQQRAARRFRRHEPITRRVMAGWCPDCGHRLGRRANSPACETCRIVFEVN
jgi:ubiquinone/menaquinone biosynthesis C-methylase UbiE